MRSTAPLLALASAAAITAAAPTAADEPLSAAESDPQQLGWMQGFPPPPEKIIRFSDDDAMASPKNRWTFSHFRDLVPTAAVDRGPARPRSCPSGSTTNSTTSPSPRSAAARS